MTEPANPRYVVAIDFGTCGSGYAYAFVRGDSLKIEEFNYFELESEKQDKVCTCLVLSHYNGQFEFRKFGSVAAKLLSDITPETRDMCGFKYFKMNLFTEKTTVESPNKFTLPVVDLIQYTLEYIVQEAYNRISASATRNLKYQEIQWVITVPAIWNDVSKNVMRVAAEKAGLPKSLILALEPEAAALCCRNNRAQLEYNPGTKYMVVDCGGGTVDIAVHEIDEEGYTHSLSAPVGGPWGSTTIDENFKALLAEIVGKTELTNNPDTMFDVMEAFEKEKKGFSGHNGVKIPLFNLKPKNDKIYHSKSEPIAFNKTFLYLKAEKMRSLYANPIESIVTCIESILKGLKSKMTYIFLVGGFSQCLILQDRIIKAFQSNETKVVIPTNPQTVVLEGGIFFGINPSAISSRYSSFTYGIKANRNFIEGKDPPEHRIVTSDKIVKCSNVFYKFISIHEKIPLKHRVIQYFGRNYSTQKEVEFPIFVSTDENPLYITKDMKEIGMVVIEVPIDEPLGVFNFEVAMEFGGTEINLTAKHKITNKEVSVRVEFQTDFLSASLMLPRLRQNQ